MKVTGVLRVLRLLVVFIVKHMGFGVCAPFFGNFLHFLAMFQSHFKVSISSLGRGNSVANSIYSCTTANR